MKKRSLRKRISYWFDRMMSKGPITMTLLLFVITMVVVCIIGIVAHVISDQGSILYQFWNSLMYTLDPGNLANVPTDNITYLLLMFLATLCGLFLTSMLIGIIATGVENMFGDLRKGTSVVQENDHVVIIGFNNNIYTILRELIEANSNKKKACIVILGKEPKEELEEALSTHVSDTKTTRIICRSGGLHESYAFERCSVETCKSVIVNVDDDPETVKIILALSAYVKEKDIRNKDLRFVASLQEEQYVEVANIAGEGRASLIFAKDAIARIISNTCRQHGLSQVLTELFDFDGDELYFENVPELYGKTFKDSMLSFSNATAVGVYSQGKAMLNPPMDTVINEGDQMILLELDDGAYEYHSIKSVDESKICNDKSIPAEATNNLIVLGSNNKLSIILAEYDKYVQQGTKVVIFDDDFDKTTLPSFNNILITVCTEEITHGLLCGFLNENANNILLLNDDSQDQESSDSQTLLRLILLRDISDKSNVHYSITTEMRNVDNQRLASQARVDDFVIGSNFISLMMTQISEAPMLMPIIDDLLDEEGSEIYMKSVVNYVLTGVPVDLYTLSESAARKGEIFLGYRHAGDENMNVIVNPRKDEIVIFGEHDQIFVIAED